MAPKRVIAQDTSKIPTVLLLSRPNAVVQIQAMKNAQTKAQTKAQTEDFEKAIRTMRSIASHRVDGDITFIQLV